HASFRVRKGLLVKKGAGRLAAVLVIGSAEVAGDHGLDQVDLGQRGRQLTDRPFAVHVHGHGHGRRHTAVGGLGGQVVDGEPALGRLVEDGPQDAVPVGITDAQRCRRGFRQRQAVAYQREEERDDEVRARGQRGEQQQAGTGRGPDGGGDPDGRGGGEATHRVAPDENEPRAEEADAGDDLRGHPGRVKHDQFVLYDVVEPVLADQHEQGRADADQGVGPQAGVLLPDLTLQADGGRKHQRYGEVTYLSPYGRHAPAPMPRPKLRSVMDACYRFEWRSNRVRFARR